MDSRESRNLPISKPLSSLCINFRLVLARKYTSVPCSLVLPKALATASVRGFACVIAFRYCISFGTAMHLQPASLQHFVCAICSKSWGLECTSFH